jgi:hypothetical protein
MIRASCGRRDAPDKRDEKSSYSHYCRVTDIRPIVSKSVTHGHTEGGGLLYQANNDPAAVTSRKLPATFGVLFVSQRSSASHDTIRHDTTRPKSRIEFPQNIPASRSRQILTVKCRRTTVASDITALAHTSSLYSLILCDESA